MSQILITGAAGLLGSRLADWIYKNTDHNLILVDDLSGGHVENIQHLLLDFRRISFQKIDVVSNKMENLFKNHEIDYVVHLAAYAAEGLSPFIRKFNYTNNLLATTNLINYSIKYGIKRFVFTSSMAVYGNAPAPFDETMKPNPVDPYGVAKYAAEMDIQIAGEQHGLDWCIIRPHNVYGRNQNLNDPYRNVLGIWMWNHMNGEPITIYGDGTQTRAFSYIDDSLEPLYNAIMSEKASKEIINLGGIDEISINKASIIFSSVVGGIDIIYLPARHEVKHAHSTWQKSVDILGFQHKTDLRTGLFDMWSWAQTQPKRKRFVWKEYELDKGIYPFWKQENMKK